MRFTWAVNGCHSTSFTIGRGAAEASRPSANAMNKQPHGTATGASFNRRCKFINVLSQKCLCASLAEARLHRQQERASKNWAGGFVHTNSCVSESQRLS